MLSHFLRSKLSTNLTFVTAPVAQGGGTGATVNVFNFNSVSIGTAHPNRYIVVCVGIYVNTTANTFSNCRLDGVDMTQVVSTSSGSSTSGSGMYILYAPTGTTANFQLNFTNTTSKNARISVYRLIHGSGTTLATNSIVAGGTLGNAVTVNTASGGAALFMGMTVSADSGAAGTPTNYTEDVESDIRSDEWFTSGICNATLGGNVSMSNTGQLRVAAASWS